MADRGGRRHGAQRGAPEGLTEKERRELAKQLRQVTGASARLCEKALQSHADDVERAANWLLEQGDSSKGGGADAASDASGPTSGPRSDDGSKPDEAEAEQDAERVLLAMATNLQSTGQFSALVVCNAGSMPPAAQAQDLQVFPRTEQAELGAMNRIFYTPFDTFAEREGAEAAVGKWRRWRVS